MPTVATLIELFWTVLLSLSAPAVPGVAPPIEIPYPTVVLAPVLMLQFLITLFVAPAPVPRLTSEIPVGAVVLVFVIVRSRDDDPLLEPSTITQLAPF